MKPLAALLSIALLSAGIVEAGTVKGDFTGVNPGEYGHVIADNTDFGPPADPDGVYTKAGLFNFTVLAASDPIVDEFVVGDHFSAFDTEMQYLTDPTTWTVAALEDTPNPEGPGGNPMGTVKADRIRELWAEHRSDVVSDATAAAFQLAIWNIVYDTDASVTSGTFRTTGFSSAATTFAANWLSDVDGVGLIATNLVGLTSLSSQDFVTEGPGGFTTTEIVPLPAGIWPGMLLLAGLAVARVRRRKRA